MQRAIDQQHRGLADEARWVKWLLEGLAWVTALAGAISVSYFIYEGATASIEVDGSVSFMIASWAFASSLVGFLVWKLLAIAVGGVSLKYRRLADGSVAPVPGVEHDAVDAARYESLVG